MSLPRELPENQLWLIAEMKQLGYRVEPEGMCLGFTWMAMQAIFSEDSETFNQRLQSIYEAKHDIELLQKVPGIYAFFDGVELYQHSNFYHNKIWRRKNACKTETIFLVENIISSLELEKKGGIHQVGCFAGVYTLGDLILYVKSLYQVVSSMPEKTTLLLSSKNHVILLTYDPKEKKWLFMDANQLPIKKIPAKKITEVVNCIMTGFFSPKDNKFVFATQLFMTGNDHLQLKTPTVFSQWKDREDFSKIHKMTKAKLKSKDKLSVFLLDLALREGLAKLVEYLLGKGAKLEDLDNTQHLFKASLKGKIKIVKVLIKYGADVNEVDDKGYTPLHAAAQNGYIDIVDCLIKYGAKINHQNGKGTSPLYMAIQSNNLAMVECLLAHGADPNLHRLTGVTPLEFAISKRKYETNIKITTALDEIINALEKSIAKKKELCLQKLGFFESMIKYPIKEEAIKSLGCIL